MEYTSTSMHHQRTRSSMYEPVYASQWAAAAADAKLVYLRKSNLLTSRVRTYLLEYSSAHPYLHACASIRACTCLRSPASCNGARRADECTGMQELNVRGARLEWRLGDYASGNYIEATVVLKRALDILGTRCHGQRP